MTGKGLRFQAFVVPESDLEWSFDPSGGPGGQHANRSSTRVTLGLDLGRSDAFPAAIRATLLDRLGPRAHDGRLKVTVDDTRSQWRNRSLARKRLTALIEEALTPKRNRRATFPSLTARRRRVKDKRRRGETKRLRREPEIED